MLTYIHLRNTGAEGSLECQHFDLPLCPSLFAGIAVSGLEFGHSSHFSECREEQGWGKRTHQLYSWDRKSLPTGAMAGTVHNPSRGAPCQLHSRGVKPLQRCSTQALPKKQELREDNTWMELTQSPCALLICGVGRAEVTGVAHPCSHPNPEHPSLQGMSPFLKWLSSSYLKVCFAYNSLLFPCPPPSKQFLSLHLVSPASKTKPLKEHLDLHICAGFFKSI